ncbi:SDR family oxidoreductase [Modestobacter sp. VKM Ac-2986]|uniref:glucose 1-dehydrogenase n=1 Tax=Modestobacter sp. VKM Ac-2986 TaxID=3004140 RepID=UPI0022AB5FD9|nr:glucose 1-dehydrogenase [Modestobacter sp. VKM Ac-2986]MCZ2830838.1 SDR family oxidoreductase [Modestobacter sp. VKM Ac-2986]
MTSSTQRFSGEVAFVTGAGTGIGRATALALVAEGARVAVSGLEGPDLTETARLVQAAGGTALALACDVSVESDVEQAPAATVEAFGRLDVAFDNAGVEQEQLPLDELATEDWHRIVAVDLTGVYHCMKHQVPLLRAAGGGSIVNTSSGAGVIGIAGQAAYAAAKWGVIGMTKSVALEVAAEGIRVNAVCTGMIDTPMMGRLSGGTDEGYQQVVSLEPVGRMGRPEEIASAVLWLSSDLGAFTVGTALVVDGGQTAG